MYVFRIAPELRPAGAQQDDVARLDIHVLLGGGVFQVLGRDDEIARQSVGVRERRRYRAARRGG